MIYGLYLNAAGALAESSRHDVISNNMANVSTPGFRASLAVFQERGAESVESPLPAFATPLDAIGGAMSISGTYTKHVQGPINVTGSKFDLAIVGDGYFPVTDGRQVLYTRAGAFTHDSQGRLVMPDGRHYLSDGAGRPIVIPSGVEVSIAADGTVSVAGEAAERINIVGFEREDLLARQGANLYDASGARARDATGQIRQGALEASGVSPVEEMAAMLMAARGYEANMQMITMQDQTLASLMTVGRVNI